MSEELYNSGRPRRTRSSVANAATPTTSSNPYKKPTYAVGRSNNATPDDSADDASNDTPTISTPARRKPGRPFGSVTKNRSAPGTPRGGGGGRRGRGRGGSNGGSSRNSEAHSPVPTLTLRKRSSTTANSPSTWTSTKARPECVASRNDRKSVSSGRGRKKRRGFGTTDYHYGSDFESDPDQIESDPDEELVPSESESTEDVVEDDMPLDEPLESDSDLSIGSARLQGLPSIPVPIWLDTEANVEELEIPRSSDDLLLSRSLLIDAIAIYEPIRRFSNLVRLTPFRFEDFCAALVSEEQSALLAEIHIQLLKALIREDEATGTSYGPNECKDSVQSVLFFADNITWAECLRAYIESDPGWTDIYKVLTSVEYPFCGAEIRLQILSWLVDAFMVGNSVRDLLTREGNIQHEDHCRACNRLGELICCESCPAVYHLCCISLNSGDEDPPDDWKCPVCEKHELLGVTDCVSEIEKAGLLLRQEPLGCDRHGRKYWFLVRRIIVESEDKSEVWYYSTRLQVEELLFRLDNENCEKNLVENILYHKEEIFRQMGVTETITTKANTNHRKTYLDAENAFLTRIHEERELIKSQEAAEKSRIEEQARIAIKKELEEKHRLEEEERIKKEEEKRRIREERLAKRNQIKLKQRLGKIADMDESLEQFILNDESKDSFMEHDDAGTKDENSDNSKPGSLDITSAILENGDVKDEEFDFNEAETQRIEDLPPVLEAEGKVEELEQEKMEVEEEVEIKTTITETEEVKLEPKDLEPLVKTSILPKIAAKSKSLNLEVDSEERMTRLRSTGLYKLGQEGSFRTYVNSYSTDVLALSKTQHTDERDRRRTMSHKFSLTQASECKWSGVQQGLRTSIVATIRQTLLNMEVAIPTTLMHCNWNLLRKTWMTAVGGCTNAREFSKALATFTAGLRPSVFNPVWAEGVGHVKLLRTTAIQKEIRKKNEKLDKKFRDDEEDRLKLFPQFVKYRIPPKHQVWKQKGEEFRLHGNYGWIWLSNLRPAKPKDARTMGLLAGPHKHVIQVKGNAGKVKTMLIDPEVYDKLMAKRAVSIETKKVDTPAPADIKPKVEPMDTEDEIECNVRAVMEGLLCDVVEGREIPTSARITDVKQEQTEDHKSQTKSIPESPSVEQRKTEVKTEKSEPSPSRKFRTELINVSLGIVSANRILYPKIAREVNVLDSLLERRIRLQSLEEKELLEEFGAQMLESMSGPPPELDTSLIVIKVDAGFPLGGGYSLSCFSYECKKAALEGKLNYESICYSPMCRLKAVIMNSRRKKIERERLADFEKRKKARKEISDRRSYNQTSTSEKVFLKKLPEDKKPDRCLVKYPHPSKFCYHSTKRPSILVLPQHDLNKLARSGARKLIPLGFTANPRPNTWLWPYPSGRPLFRTTWQYRTAVQANSLHAAAFQLRVLYACVRWDDIQMKPLNPEGKNQVTTDMEVITSEILNHRIVGRFQEAYQYLRRRHVVPIDAPKTIREVTPSRSGLRKRKRAESPDNSQPEVKEEWVDEEKFEVWEIRLYGEKIEKKNEKKPEPPSSSTRTKTGVTLRIPEKWDPSPKEVKEKEPAHPTPPQVSTPPTKFLPVSAMTTRQELVEPELRIAHPSKRDNHAKITTNPNKIPTPTASQQLLLQQQQSAAAAAAAANQGLPPGSLPATKAISLMQTTTPSGRKFFTSKPSLTGSIRPVIGSSHLKELPKTGILKKPIIASPLAVGSAQNISASALINSTATPIIGATVRPAQPQQITLGTTASITNQQKVQVFRTEDGIVQVNGLLPGQTAYQTSDGNVHVMNNSTMVDKTKGMTHLNPSPVTLFRSQGVLSSSPAINQPRVNISNPAIRTVITTSPSLSPSPRALVRPTETRKPSIIKQALAPSIIRVNRTAEDLKDSSLHLQIGRNTIEVKHKDIVKSASGEDQIFLGAGLPIIQLLPSPSRTPVQPIAETLDANSAAEPPPLQQPETNTLAPQQEVMAPGQQQPPTTILANTIAAPTTPTLQDQIATTVVTTSSPATVMAAGSKIVYNEGNRSFVLNTTGYTEAQVQALIVQLQEKKIIIKGTETPMAQPQPQQQIVQQQVLLPQGLMAQGQVQGHQMFVQQTQQVLVQAPQNATVLSQQPQRMIATIGGQRVIFNRAGTTPQRSITPVGGTPAQVFQKLVPTSSGTGYVNLGGLPSHKTVISVTPPVTHSGYGSPQPGQIISSAAALARTPLPISIVSPSKPRLTHQTTTPIRLNLLGQAQVQTPPATSTSPSGHPGIMTSQQLTGLLQQRHVTAIATSSPLASVRIPTSLTSSPQVRTQFVQLQGTSPQVSAASPRLPTILRPITPVSNPAQRSKVIAQVVQTPEGPCLKVQGIPPNLSPSMLAQLDAQLAKQMPGVVRKDGLGSLLVAAGVQASPSAGGGITLAGGATQVIQHTTRPRLLTPSGRQATRKAQKAIQAKVLAEASLPAPLMTPVPKVSEQLAQGINDGLIDEAAMAQDFELVQGDSNMAVAEEVTISSSENVLSEKRQSGGRSPVAKKRKMSEISSSSGYISAAPEKILASPPHDFCGDIEAEAEARFVLTQDFIQSETLSVPDISGEDVLASVPRGSEDDSPPLDIMEPSACTSDLSSSSASAMSTLAGLCSDVQQQTIRNSPHASPPAAPAKVSRRKSPVRSDGTQSAKTAAVALHKALNHLYKQKEFLKKDMFKKRALLEKDLLLEIQAELMEEVKKQEPPMNENGETEGKGKKRKSSEAKPVMKTSKGRASLPAPGTGKHASRKPKSRKKGAELFCTCQKPYDRNKFYVGCDKCDKWYHGECVGITEEMSRLLSEYVCLECINAPPVPLYCVCRQPYDDTQFYIACDKCDDWLHGRCVGVLPVEGSKMDQYVCASCDPTTPLNRLTVQTLKSDDYVHLEKLVKQIKAHKSATAFRKPVDVSLAPNYFRVIKDPMDLCEVEHRVEQKRYARLTEFIGDISLIFDNCRYFNQPESQFCKSANVLEGFFAQKLKILREQLLSE